MIRSEADNATGKRSRHRSRRRNGTKDTAALSTPKPTSQPDVTPFMDTGGGMTDSNGMYRLCKHDFIETIVQGLLLCDRTPGETGMIYNQVVTFMHATLGRLYACNPVVLNHSTSNLLPATSVVQLELTPVITANSEDLQGTELKTENPPHVPQLSDVQASNNTSTTPTAKKTPEEKAVSSRERAAPNLDELEPETGASQQSNLTSETAPNSYGNAHTQNTVLAQVCGSIPLDSWAASMKSFLELPPGRDDILEGESAMKSTRCSSSDLNSPAICTPYATDTSSVDSQYQQEQASRRTSRKNPASEKSRVPADKPRSKSESRVFTNSNLALVPAPWQSHAIINNDANQKPQTWAELVKSNPARAAPITAQNTQSSQLEGTRCLDAAGMTSCAKEQTDALSMCSSQGTDDIVFPAEIWIDSAESPPGPHTAGPWTKIKGKDKMKKSTKESKTSDKKTKPNGNQNSTSKSKKYERMLDIIETKYFPNMARKDLQAAVHTVRVRNDGLAGLTIHQIATEIKADAKARGDITADDCERLLTTLATKHFSQIARSELETELHEVRLNHQGLAGLKTTDIVSEIRNNMKSRKVNASRYLVTIDPAILEIK